MLPIILSDCKHDEFSCSDGKCKNRYSKNDGYKDCNDGSDETERKYNYCKHLGEICINIYRKTV